MKEIDKKFDKIRCNLYIPSEIVEEVDAMSKMYGASRSVMVSFILKTYLDQQKVVNLARLVPPQE
jgi:metal-responsive CopG/Arc/MetJ family transcriptional regulator